MNVRSTHIRRTVVGVFQKCAFIAWFTVHSTLVIGQTNLADTINTTLPDTYRFTYKVHVKYIHDKAYDDAMAEMNIRGVEENVSKGLETPESAKASIASIRATFAHGVPDRRFTLTMAHLNGKLYIESNEKSLPCKFIYDGKRSYFYKCSDHSLEVSEGMNLPIEISVPLLGPRYAEFQTAEHTSIANADVIEGEMYGGQFEGKSGPLYLPGRIERARNDATAIGRIVSYNGTKLYREYLLTQHVNFGKTKIPGLIEEIGYNQASRQKGDMKYEVTAYKLISFSTTSPPGDLFDPTTSLKRDYKGDAVSPVFVQWQGNDEAFLYHPDKSLDEQAGYVRYQKAKAQNAAAQGRIDPRNYIGLVLLVSLVCMIGWNYVSRWRLRTHK